MIPRTPKLLLLFPGALGDFICFLPALAALRAQFDDRVVVAAKPSLLELLPPTLERFSIDRREVADLFANDTPREETRALLNGFTHVHSWTGHGDDVFAARLRALTRTEAMVHPFRRMGSEEHATLYYARCAHVSPGSAEIEIPATAHRWATERLRGTRPLLIHAGSGGLTKNWSGFPLLAERWRAHGDVMWLVGPADIVPADVEPAHIIRDQPLVHVAALLQKAWLFVGNDSGISHLAGLVKARGLALFGRSDPIIWRPLGLHVLQGVAAPDRCGHDAFCLDQLSVDVVDAALASIAA